MLSPVEPGGRQLLTCSGNMVQHSPRAPITYQHAREEYSARGRLIGYLPSGTGDSELNWK